ncbi:SCO7613 C-terminal domain-containing membrane protein [Streptomyces sp. A5-4]|uniref:SCO7613 C-terminal domain-containing membrane protein n=1 Tax=Streptomyces sp. A5-4 TaxID=3384771 RepID=UPI003DA8E18A
MENAPPPAEELVILDRELVQLDARRAQLLARRAWLISVLWPPVPQAPPFARAQTVAPLGAGHVPRAPKDTSAPGAQNVLLTLGGLLLTIAAIAFTLVSWGDMGIGGRSVVLGAVTALALATPALLLRRGLVSTAESVAALGLALTVLDAYALHRVALADVDGVGYVAVASAVLAALWTAYGLTLGRLRIPLPAALIAAQLPLLLWSLAAGAGPLSAVWALLATAALDVAVALWTTGRAVRPLAYTLAWFMGGWALIGAGGMAAAAGDAGDALRPGALLLAVAALGLFTAWRAPSSHAVAPAVAAGLAVIAAVGGAIRPAVPETWAVPGYVLCAVALLAVVRAGLPRPMTLGLAAAAGAVVAGGAVWALPPVAATLLGPVNLLERVWSGAPDGIREALSGEFPWSWAALTSLVLLIAAAALVTAYRPASADRAWRPAAVCGALALTWSALLAAPAALGFGYPAAMSLYVLLTAATLAVAVRRSAPVTLPAGGAPVPGPPATVARPEPTAPAVGGPLALTAFGCALATSAATAMLSLASEAATLTVLGVLLALFTAYAAYAADRVTPLVGVCAAVVYATGLTAAVAASFHLPPHQVALAVLAAPAAVAVLAARLPRSPLTLPLEITGAAAALLAIGLAAGDAATLALVLALCGVVLAGSAVRDDRRPVGHAAVVLFVLAAWVRLAASDVVTPEAYTLPVTVPALVVGVLRRRRDPQASSWAAYGPGLAATLLPSLFAAWGDEHWPRPLLLGAVALAVTLTGARHRLQALLMLGGAVLALDALHELAPYVVQAVGALPRWLPPALVGLLLLAVGATYEQRLRDARRLRETLGRMR